jgi:cytochrome P450
MVLMSQWLKHRDGRVFPDPLQFRPERWLGETVLPKFAYFPFGGGPRICIGSGLAMMEAPLGLAALAQQYAFEPVSTAPVVPWASITLHPEGGMPLRLRRRTPKR